MAAYRRESEGLLHVQALLCHCVHHGQGAERPEFGMKVLRYHTSATTRQVHEACVIWQRSRGVKKGEGRILNSKSMFNRCKLQSTPLLNGPISKNCDQRSGILQYYILSGTPRTP